MGQVSGGPVLPPHRKLVVLTQLRKGGFFLWLLFALVVFS